MVKREHGVWLGLAHRRLTSSVYLITGQTGKRDQQSARRGCEPSRRAENEKLEPLAAAASHTRVKKKEGEEENVIFSKKNPKNPTLLSLIDDGFILFAAFKIKFF